MRPYGVISDTHNHGWSAFATTLPTGVNSRLQVILDETLRAGREVLKQGGQTLFHGGDLFHVRGNLAPSVLNPTMAAYQELIDMGLQIVINAGNHDLEGKEAADVSSAITALRGIGCRIVNKVSYGLHDDVAIIPWIANIKNLKEAIEAIDPADRPGTDLLLHAPIDGVIKGLPDHGLSDVYLAGLGFRRVFSGHYHHHKDFGNGVYSIGATTHQTWSDIGSKAGFLIVSDAGVKWHSTHAPQFVEIDGSTSPEDIPLIVDGNYARVTINSAKTGDVDATRQFLMDSGALGVIVLSEKTAGAASTRVGSTYKAGTSMETSIGDYIKSKPEFTKPSELQALCLDVLAQVRSI
jgi:DNA repair exonuclease SbcCD nuclease subunit